MALLKGLYSAHIATLTERTSVALEQTGFERVVIHAGDLIPHSRFDDNYFPFKPTPAYAHWASLPWPGSAVVVEKGQGAKLYARQLSDFWENYEAPDRELVESGLEVEDFEDLERIRSVLHQPGTAFVGNSVQAASQLGFDKKYVNPPSLIEALHELRVRKTPYEIESIVEANRLAVKGHKAVEEAFLAGERSELALHLIYLSATQQDDSQTPYKNIVALGTAAAVLHHNAYGDRPEAKTLLIDAGARVRGYNSDITRTHLDTSDRSEFRALLTAMDALEQGLMDYIQVGKSYEALHDECHHQLGQLLVDLQFVSCSAEAAVSEGLTRIFFPHGLGHSLGVQVHDVGCRKVSPREENVWLRNTRAIESEQIFTVEPGFYFIDALLDPLKASTLSDLVRWDRVDPLRIYGGIRVEDNVQVLNSDSELAYRNLTREAFLESQL